MMRKPFLTIAISSILILLSYRVSNVQSSACDDQPNDPSFHSVVFSTSSVWTVPEGVTNLCVALWGAGGGGGPGDSYSNGGAPLPGAGGGSGAYALKERFQVNPGASCTVDVGGSGVASPWPTNPSGGGGSSQLKCSGALVLGPVFGGGGGFGGNPNNAAPGGTGGGFPTTFDSASMGNNGANGPSGGSGGLAVLATFKAPPNLIYGAGKGGKGAGYYSKNGAGENGYAGAIYISYYDPSATAINIKSPVVFILSAVICILGLVIIALVLWFNRDRWLRPRSSNSKKSAPAFFPVSREGDDNESLLQDHDDTWSPAKVEVK
eukprot:TRINITY_DN7338_c0_g1_i1.p1 TRINITY_DN7338_c0_g1~~TRINITY_DN7338_c0_g1_i1.p1  ORF type:complete len:321 (-),score=31.86 TRINITY_DN7338_c0_g1_i1:39-1001(-)